MNLIKPKTLSILHKPHRYHGKDWFVISPICIFTLSKNPEVLEETDPRADFNSLLSGQIFDLCMPKPRAEYLVVGSAHAPAGRSVKQMRVRAQVAEMTKQLHVVGDRTYKKTLLGLRHLADKDKEFASVPLSYEYAYGGEGVRANPIGKGFYKNRSVAAASGANLFYRKPTTTVGGDARSPSAALGPVGVDWPIKIEQAGTYNQDWLDNHNPGYPPDIDFGFFNRAAEDQQTVRHFKGGDTYRLEGMHPSKPVICGRIPNIAFRIFIQRSTAVGQEQRQPSQEEIAAKIDTLWFFPEQGIGVMVGRGMTQVSDCDALDIASLMLAYEHDIAGDNWFGGTMRPQSHYDQVLALRTDKKQGLKHVFNEAQLTPQKTEAQLQALKQARRAYHQHREEQNTALQNQIRSLVWPAEEPPFTSEANDNELKPSYDDTPTPEEIQSGDFDLSSYLEFSEKVTAQAITDAEQCQAQADDMIRQAAGPAAEHGTQCQALAADDKALSDEILAELQGDSSEPMPPLADIERLAGLLNNDNSVEQIENIAAEISRCAEKIQKQHTVSDDVATQPIPTAIGDAKRDRVVELLTVNANLKGLDLSFANLRGLNLVGRDLSGCDFSESDLSSANLTGCNFTDTIFYRCYAENADFSHSQFRNSNMSGLNASRVNFSGCRFEGGQWHSSTITESIWHQATLCNMSFYSVSANAASFDHAVFSQITLINCNFTLSDFSGSSFSKVNMTRCELNRSVFKDAALCGVAWVESGLQYADFSGAKLSKCTALANTCFSDTDFTDASVTLCGFGKVDFSQSIMTKGCFAKSDFSGADFSGANLDGASFAFSLLNGATIKRCSAKNIDLLNGLCRKADFSCSDLTASQFYGADLFEACFDKAIITRTTLSPLANIANALCEKSKGVDCAN